MEVSFNLLTDIYNLMIIMAIFTFINKNNTQLFSLGLKLPFDISISLGYAVYDNEPDGSSSVFIKRSDERMYTEKGLHHENPPYGLIIILYKNRRHYGVSQRKKENW